MLPWLQHQNVVQLAWYATVGYLTQLFCTFLKVRDKHGIKDGKSEKQVTSPTKVGFAYALSNLCFAAVGVGGFPSLLMSNPKKLKYLRKKWHFLRLRYNCCARHVLN
jgi:hypothetical protein